MAILCMANGSHLRQSTCTSHNVWAELIFKRRPPKRDWRDWFIMATMMGGVGYGLYFITKVC